MDYLKKIEYKIAKEINNFIGVKTYKAVMKISPEYGLQKNTPPIVVSMASYAGRYNTIIPTLKSLVCQSYKPDRIIIWLDENSAENEITTQMKAFEEYGVEYYDFNLLTMDTLPRTDDDFFDEEGHMLGELADRYSDILASVLLDKCDKSTAFYGTYAQLEQAVYENYVTK